MGLKNSVDEHFPRVLHDKNKIPANQFSLCMTDEDYTSPDGYLAGYMTLGGVDTTLHTGPMMYASASDYQVTIRSIYLQPSSHTDDESNNKKKQARGLTSRLIKISPDHENYDTHAVDSGTTITYFSTVYAPKFKKEWEKLTGFEFPSSDEDEITITDEQFNTLPTILVQIEGKEDCNQKTTETNIARKLVDSEHCKDVVLSFPPSHYIYKLENGKYNINISFEDM